MSSDNSDTPGNGGSENGSNDIPLRLVQSDGEATPVEPVMPPVSSHRTVRDPTMVTQLFSQMEPLVSQWVDPVAMQRLARSEVARRVTDKLIEFLDAECLTLDLLDQRNLVTLLINRVTELSDEAEMARVVQQPPSPPKVEKPIISSTRDVKTALNSAAFSCKFISSRISATTSVSSRTNIW